MNSYLLKEGLGNKILQASGREITVDFFFFAGWRGLHSLH
jgi:hypothetical protein